MMPTDLALDMTRIRIAAEDNAARYYGGPLNLGKSDAARYVAEGCLAKLCDQYGLKAVWQAVAECIDADPEMLTWSQLHRDQRHEERVADANHLDKQALAAFEAGDLDEAHHLIQAAELTCPDLGDWAGAYAAIAKAKAERDNTDDPRYLVVGEVYSLDEVQAMMGQDCTMIGFPGMGGGR